MKAQGWTSLQGDERDEDLTLVVLRVADSHTDFCL